ncbi:MAG: adenosylcobalamin-dependent ribonucleoside-diphosphate reductase [Desulfotomaculales bacterium]
MEWPPCTKGEQGTMAIRPSWSENALRVWRLRFLDEGETPEERLRLVAMETSYKAALKYGLSEEEARRRAEELYQLMVEKKFMFNSPTIRNAGRDPKLSKAACFVIPLGDSMPEIFDAVKTAALIQQAGGGVGADFTPLRPKGDIIASTGGKSSGPVGFMRIFDAAAEEIKQGGVRRGAWMFSLRANHPDIEEFVATEFKNANTSVSADDRFMRKVTGEDPDPSWELVNPRDGKVWKVVDAKDLFQKIVKRAHATGNPGLLFLDRINADNPLPQLGPITATNPCGEQPLHPNHACNLGSINLGLYWDTKRRKVKWGELFRDARIATRGLNDVIETAHYPTPEIDKAVRASMQIGLGVMGLADLLIQAELPYDSPEGRRLAARCLRVIRWAARTESRALAQERGTFPLWEGSLWGQKGIPVRNAAMTTVAPTGTIGVLVDASSGIEPLFAVAYIRRTHEGQELKYIHPAFVEVARIEGFYSEDLMQDVARRGTVVGVPGVPEKWQGIFKGAHDIRWRDHILMQAELQKYVDNAISKTVNLPHDATEEDIWQAYTLAWHTGCKGITVFRDGCRKEQVLTITQQPPQHDGGTICAEWGKYVPPALPPEMPARRYYVDTPVGELQLFVVTDEKNRPVEIFGQVGKAGSDINADVEAICRITSVALRAGIALWYVVKQLHGIGGANSVGFGPKRVRSIADAIGKVLNAHFLNPGAEELTTEGNVITGVQGKEGDVLLDLCPQCGNATLVHQDGCRRCLNPDCLYEAC